MRVARTPLRITLGGGGSDLAPNGICITAAISVYVYVAYNENHTDEIVCKYQSKVERAATLDQIVHPLIRECLRDHDRATGYELTSLSDIHGGSGLGSSAAFTLSTLAALHPDQSQRDWVNHAVAIDTGWQDQYACGYGGVAITSDDGCAITTADLTPLRLYDTGLRHDSAKTLRENKRPSQATLREQADDALAGIQVGDFGFLSDQWELKFALAPTPEHQAIDTMIRQLGVPAKLVGAGNGGMILAWSPDPIDTPLREIPFHVDHQGTVLL